ncbi:GspH/FimT family pseudopilin [Legionella maioricensis]|uniref:Type II secretion system protein H n=1 Tax=Legionella maioricensis TaxID=2896528 RepID=A0A9X2D0M2_9GAMM|nr:GspH/FimT family pseudopilin [Legionella maioricensis]MCL9684251.1 GspH/FimT family pseudopilin [Legionella maioricensis]MCL9687117.1 GspH/FimT family pseudopilin [Legionella maioricensis]
MMKIKGFTLIEVLITLIFLAGLSLLSISSASFLTYKNERQTLIDEIRTAIQYAKIQAITLGHPVYLAPVDTSLNWSKGMILAQYNNKKNTSAPLYQWRWHHPRWNITWTGAGALNKIMLSNNPVSAISNGQFVLFNSYTKERVVIVLNKLGRIKIKSKD